MTACAQHVVVNGRSKSLEDDLSPDFTVGNHIPFAHSGREENSVTATGDYRVTDDTGKCGWIEVAYITADIGIAALPRARFCPRE